MAFSLLDLFTTVQKTFVDVNCLNSTDRQENTKIYGLYFGVLLFC